MLRVDGVPPETKKQLQEAARQLYGKPNASLLVRSMIASHPAWLSELGRKMVEASKRMETDPAYRKYVQSITR